MLGSPPPRARPASGTATRDFDKERARRRTLYALGGKNRLDLFDLPQGATTFLEPPHAERLGAFVP